MSQPFHIYGSPDGGRSLVRRPIVLARIPHVGAQVGTVAESAPVGHTTPAPAVESQPGAFSQGTRFYVDSQHTSVPPAEPETQSRSSSNRRRHRAHGYPRSPESSSADSPQPGVATGLSRLHGELASYASLIVTLVLVASGALLYWMIIAPSQVPVVDYSNSYETFGSAGIEIPKFTPPTTPLAKRQFASPSELFELPGTTAKSAPELIRLPEQTPAPSNEPEPVFNDASAWAYPATDHPLGWDSARLGVTDIAGENAAASSSRPEMAQRAAPPRPTPVNR